MNYYRIKKAFTNAPLGAAGVFTSDVIQLTQYNRLTGIVFSDVAGSLDIEQSIDGVNFDVKTTVAVAAGVGDKFDVPVYGEYARVKYTNGATPQTVFRLGAYATPVGV